MKLGCKSTSPSRECADFPGSQISQLDAVPKRDALSRVCVSLLHFCLLLIRISHLGLSSESFQTPQGFALLKPREPTVCRVYYIHKLAQRQWFCALEYKEVHLPCFDGDKLWGIMNVSELPWGSGVSRSSVWEIRSLLSIFHIPVHQLPPLPHWFLLEGFP